MNTSCNTCGKEVAATYLGKHYQRYNKLNAKIFPCDDCDKKYFEKRRLEHHVIATHNRIIPHDNLCIECGKTFVSEERLREHKSSMHTREEITYTFVTRHFKTIRFSKITAESIIRRCRARSVRRSLDKKKKHAE